VPNADDEPRGSCSPVQSLLHTLHAGHADHIIEAGGKDGRADNSRRLEYLSRALETCPLTDALKFALRIVCP
jgi:hypothetical protein